MRYNFARKNRLTTEAQFKQVFSKAQKKITTEIFTSYCYYNTFIYPRLGVIIPKRQVNKSSTRNLLKRLIREWFRLHQDSLAKIDIVIVVSKKIESFSKLEIKEKLEDCLLNKL